MSEGFPIPISAVAGADDRRELKERLKPSTSSAPAIATRATFRAFYAALTYALEQVDAAPGPDERHSETSS
jgi:hypothetical protein